MAGVEDELERWSKAGLLDAETARRIREFESGRNSAAAAGRPGILEALVYLGVAVIAVGVAILVGSSWGSLRPWARLAVTAGPGLFALLGGHVARQSQPPGIKRGGQLAWLVATALLAGAAAVAGENAKLASEDVVLGAAIAGALVAVTLWAVAPSHAQVVGLGATLFLLAIALGARSQDFNFAVAGLSLAAFGIAGLVLVERRVLLPITSSRAAAAAGLGGGAFWAGFQAAGYEPLAFAAAAGLLILGIWRGTFVYVLAGLVVLFLALVSTVTRHVSDPTAAAGSFILLGALLVAVVLGLARWQPWARSEG